MAIPNQIGINSTVNTVNINDNNNSITVSSSFCNTLINVTQSTTNIITVATPGPQGIAGITGPPGTGSFETSSFATTGSNIFDGNQIITGSIISTLGFTGSLFGTSSWAINAITASYTDISTSSSFSTTASYWSGSIINAATASYVLNAISSSFATTSSFIDNLNQSIVITGSTQGNVTTLTISSNTASLDFNLGNFFTLQLAEGINTYIEPLNIRSGQSSILLLSTTGSATVSFPSTVKQPSGSSYTPTTTTGTDILTFVSLDNSNLYLVSVKNLI